MVSVEVIGFITGSLLGLIVAIFWVGYIIVRELNRIANSMEKR